MRDLTSGQRGAELRLAAARAANALAARASQTEPAAFPYTPCSTQKTELLYGPPYAPWCKQAPLEQGIRRLEAEGKAYATKYEEALPSLEFDGSWHLRCWKVTAEDANDFFDPNDEKNGPPTASETVNGINFEWSTVWKTIRRRFYESASVSSTSYKDQFDIRLSSSQFEDIQELMDDARVGAHPNAWTIGGVAFTESFVCSAKTKFVSPTTGTATIYSEADDGSMVYIHEASQQSTIPVVDNSGDGRDHPQVRAANYHFIEGRTYQVEASYYQARRSKTWKLYWHPPWEPRCYQPTSGAEWYCKESVDAVLFTPPASNPGDWTKMMKCDANNMTTTHAPCSILVPTPAHL